MYCEILNLVVCENNWSEVDSLYTDPFLVHRKHYKAFSVVPLTRYHLAFIFKIKSRLCVWTQTILYIFTLHGIIWRFTQYRGHRIWKEVSYWREDTSLTFSTGLIFTVFHIPPSDSFDEIVCFVMRQYVYNPCGIVEVWDHIFGRRSEVTFFYMLAYHAHWAYGRPTSSSG